MTDEKFIAIQNLKDRIVQLQMLKGYLETFFECKPLTIQITTTVLGVEQSQKIPSLNGKHETYQHFLADPSDKQFILERIESRITDLQDQFKKM